MTIKKQNDGSVWVEHYEEKKQNDGSVWVENEVSRRKALAEFRGQKSDPSIYEKAFDGSFIVHGGSGGKCFWVVNPAEREQLFVAKLESMLEQIKETGVHYLPDEEINSVICGGSDDYNFPFENTATGNFIHGWWILYNPSFRDADWQESQELYRNN